MPVLPPSSRLIPFRPLGLPLSPLLPVRYFSGKFRKQDLVAGGRENRPNFFSLISRRSRDSTRKLVQAEYRKNQEMRKNNGKNRLSGRNTEVPPSTAIPGGLLENMLRETLHKRGEDLSEKEKKSLQGASAFRARRLLGRPVAPLPRNYVKVVTESNPTGLELRDLSVPAPSVFRERNDFMQDSYEKRVEKNKEEGNTDDMWFKYSKVKRSKVVWAAAQKFENERVEREKQKEDAKPSHLDRKSLKSVLDLKSLKDRRWSKKTKITKKMDPQNLSIKVLKTARRLSASTNRGFCMASAQSNQGPSAMVSEVVSESLPPATSPFNPEKEGRLPTPAAGLIRLLREKAIAYGQTGLNPSLMETMKQQLKAHPGVVKETRQQEYDSIAQEWTLEKLISENRATLENCNQLLLSLALGSKNKDDKGVRVEGGGLKECLEVFNQMSSLGFSPDEDTFVALLKATHNNARAARGVWLKMRENMISPTTKAYNALIKVHVRAQNLTSGFALLRKMQDEDIEADVSTYTILIDGLVKRGKVELAREQFNSMRTWKGIEPDEVLFTVMMSACIPDEECEQALCLLEDMRTCGLYPTDITYAVLIKCMASRSDFAEKAFLFWRQMDAEEMPLNTRVAESLVQACKSLGNIARLRETVQLIVERDLPLALPMFSKAVGCVASAMRLPKVTDFERVAHLRLAWHLVADVKRRGLPVRTELLNEITDVYRGGGFAQHAVEMLPNFLKFNSKPNDRTYLILLEMLGKDLKDPGRFFALWEFYMKKVGIDKEGKGKELQVISQEIAPLWEDQNKIVACAEKIKRNSGGGLLKGPDADLLHLALDVAMDSRSAQKTLDMLELMLEKGVYPKPQHAQRLAKVGRKVVQIHRMMGRFVQKQREETHKKVTRRTALVLADAQEHEALLAKEGLTIDSRTPYHEARFRKFDRMKRLGLVRKRPWLPLEAYIQSKKKGGAFYARRHDKPKPNLLALNAE